ncbi:MAG: dTDP-4-dehydrorhamnose 3,5-epimerase [Deltaproteobacteria bacterium]|nr:dTDP-4-dehydrorhamnose 3,5-epimerase [Deltaproteobacteria bacterium]
MKVLAHAAVPDVRLLEPEASGDGRGFLFESFNRRDWEAALGAPLEFVQENHSLSTRHVLRGLHYQLAHPQAKLVRVVRGEAFDVAVDLRRGSRTFGRWSGTVLSAENRLQAWIPTGFAHGFLVLSDVAEVIYKLSDYWRPDDQHCIRWDDPDLAVAWPLGGAVPVLSGRDAAGKRLAESPVFDVERA